MKNKISVVINFHNGEKYLEKCIESVLSQNYKNFEVILWDNASVDSSKKIIDKFKDKKIKYFRHSSKENLYKARNRAVEVSSGKLIAFLDCDDWWDKNYLSSKEKFFGLEEYDYFYSNVLCFYEKTNKLVKYNHKKLPNGKIYNYLAKDYFIIISGLIIKKKILEKENYFNGSYSIIGDYDLLMRISKYTNAKSFDEPMIYYRIHKNNFSKKNNKMYFEEYNHWFHNQKNLNNKLFQENIEHFHLRLSKLKIIHLLYKKRNFELFVEIIKFPQLSLKFKFFFAFFLPIQLINFFRK
tara:strand:+ start:1473 stop:2360 length:888 start_codon:yes stop_codon:yes gene_type:complete